MIATPSIPHAPITPIAELADWKRTLTRIADQPLEFCPRFAEVAARHEAWWNQRLDGPPLLIATANGNPNRPIDRRLSLLCDAESWFAAKLADMKQTHLAGDALPHIRADFGPVLIGGMLGGTIEFQSDTTWTHSFINDDWSNAPDWILREDNPWWNLLHTLAKRVCQDAPGRYLLCTPDLGGSADVLLNLRGSSELCLDAIECPQRLKDAQDAIYPTWHRAFTMLYRTAMTAGAGVNHWVQLWSNRPYMVPACDFNYMIGPDEFRDICLPDIARQSETIGRAVFHLDGPGATRHIDALLEVPAIRAIQFTPGTGTPSALEWIPMFRKIQSAGRSLLIFALPEEVVTLAEQLDPRATAFLVSMGTPAEVDALHTSLAARFR